MTKTLIFFIVTLCSLSGHGITLNPYLDSGISPRFLKYLGAVKEVERVVNGDEFRLAIISASFSYTDKTGASVLQSIYESSEILSPGKDGVWSWGVGFYYKKNTKVIGWTNQKTSIVWVNTAKFDSMNTWEIADNIAHEYMHKIGFGHRSARDYNSVPYAVGFIVERLVKKNLTEYNKPVPGPVVTPRKPGKWERFKRFLKRGF